MVSANASSERLRLVFKGFMKLVHPDQTGRCQPPGGLPRFGSAPQVGLGPTTLRVNSKPGCNLPALQTRDFEAQGIDYRGSLRRRMGGGMAGKMGNESPYGRVLFEATMAQTVQWLARFDVGTDADVAT